MCERVTSGGAVWLVVRVVFVVVIKTWNTLQWPWVRDTNSCKRLITCSRSIRERNVVKLAQTNIRRFLRLTYNAMHADFAAGPTMRADYYDFVGGPTISAD